MAARRHRGLAGLLAAVLCGWVATAGAAAPPPGERPAGRFLGTFAVTANPIDVLDANPLFLGKPTAELTARDVANLDLYAAGRVGTVADGVSILLLRVRVPYGGRVSCEVVGGEANGTCQPLALPPAPPTAGSATAAVIYQPPETFGPGAGDTPQRYMDAVETRDVVVRLSLQSPAGSIQTADKRLLLARPPLVLVHGTFDSPELFDRAAGGMSFATAMETAGFKTFAVDYGSAAWLTQGGTNQASFATNRDVVWSNPNGIRDALDYFRRDLSLAAARADVVGHSLGGLLPRVYASPGYAGQGHPYERDDNFGKGDINRLVTMCTPHYGSVLPAVLKVFAAPDVDRAGVLGTALGRVTLSIKQYWDGLDTEGAVRDQMPESAALRRIGPTPIPAFAIGCIAGADDVDDPVFDPAGEYSKRIADLTWLFYLAPGLLEQYLTEAGMPQEAEQLPWMLDAFYQGFIARLAEANVGWLTAPEGAPDPRAHQQPELQQVFRALLFQYQPNDYTVGLESQHGGLPEGSRRDIEGVLHSAAPQYWTVQKRVIDVLKGEGAAGEDFAAAGFPEAGRAVKPGEPSDELLALLGDLAGGDVAAGDGRSRVARLLDGVTSDAYLRDEEAIRWSGMVYAHALKFMKVAEDERTVFMFRPVNPDSTRLIADNAATKPMNIKAKSSDWGPQRGLLPVDQAFSKKAEASADTIAAFDCDAYDNLKKNAANAAPLTVTVDGVTYEVRTTRRSSGAWEKYGCELDAKGKYAPTAAFKSALAERLTIGERQPLVLYRVGADGTAEYRAAAGAPLPAPMPPEATLPFMVFADDDGKYMTADYDMLAIGSQSHTCEPGDVHPVYGAICAWQIPLVVALNTAAGSDACAYSGGNLVHHGPEAQYPGSQYVDYPIVAFIPAWRGDPSRIVTVRQGPDGYRDMHLKRLFAMLRLQGWNIDPNPTAVGWQWGEFSPTTGYEPRDQAEFPPDVPEELVPPSGAALEKACDPGIGLASAGAGR